MDSRAKQRLTGAVILVALFVLLVPELLTGPGKDAAPPGTTDEAGMRRYDIQLDAPTGSAQPVSTPQPAPEVALPPVAEKPVAETPKPEAVRAQPGEAAQVETPAPVAPKPAPTTASRETVATNPVPTVPAPTPVAKPAPLTPANLPKGAFAVQLGSFGDKGNADRLVREMTAKGFNAFVAPITSGGRELYRVRVGPTRDRASAEALAVQLKRMGQTGSIVPIS
jgi:DedD protein